MFTLFVSLALLGLSSVDPVGIGIMPVLLSQTHPYRRSFAFLGGSFVSLAVMGTLFTKGLGRAFLNFERHSHWLVPTLEATAGTILLIIAATVYWQVKSGKVSVEPSSRVLKWLKLKSWHLFTIGLLLVTGQSMLDVVFVIAMIKIGQLHISNVTIALAIVTYAVAALALQLAVVLAFWLAPEKNKHKILKATHRLLLRYSNQAIITVSLLLGCILLGLAA